MTEHFIFMFFIILYFFTGGIVAFIMWAFAQIGFEIFTLKHFLAAFFAWPLIVFVPPITRRYQASFKPKP